MKCDNCKREIIVENDIIMVVCRCGETMEVKDLNNMDYLNYYKS